MINMTRFNGATCADNFDKADVVALIIAMAKAEDDDGESFISINYEDVYSVAVDAAQALHKETLDEGEEWDGCVWLEDIGNHHPGGLAYILARDCVRDEQPAYPRVKQWLEEVNFLNSKGDV